MNAKTLHILLEIGSVCSILGAAITAGGDQRQRCGRIGVLLAVRGTGTLEQMLQHYVHQLRSSPGDSAPVGA